MWYTALFAHFKTLKTKKGATLKRKSKIGVEGNTGFSTAAHCHIAVAEGKISDLNKMRLSPLVTGATKPSKKQCERMLTEYLMSTKYKTTTTYLEKAYEKQFGQKHPAVDVSATKWDAYIQWPISEQGKVVKTGFDSAYGNYVLVQFEVKDTIVKTTSTTAKSSTPAKVKLKGKVWLYDVNGKKYPTPSTATKTCKVLSVKGKYYKISHINFDTNPVYVKKSKVKAVK